MTRPTSAGEHILNYDSWQNEQNTTFSLWYYFVLFAFIELLHSLKCIFCCAFAVDSDGRSTQILQLDLSKMQK